MLAIPAQALLQFASTLVAMESRTQLKDVTMGTPTVTMGVPLLVLLSMDSPAPLLLLMFVHEFAEMDLKQRKKPAMMAI